MSQRYEIVTSGPVGRFATESLEDVESGAAGPGRWRLAGTVPDTAALLGLLHRLADAHVEVLELRRIQAA